mmetsp:Transcript_14744/g.41236  ORF Transcript_14744/g.41236 Transcript_14744/m.41236 type:complete len:136 (-) Transcript_14744:1408-1815(-)
MSLATITPAALARQPMHTHTLPLLHGADVSIGIAYSQRRALLLSVVNPVTLLRWVAPPLSTLSLQLDDSLPRCAPSQNMLTRSMSHYATMPCVPPLIVTPSSSVWFMMLAGSLPPRTLKLLFGSMPESSSGPSQN